MKSCLFSSTKRQKKYLLKGATNFQVDLKGPNTKQTEDKTDSMQI